MEGHRDVSFDDKRGKVTLGLQGQVSTQRHDVLIPFSAFCLHSHHPPHDAQPSSWRAKSMRQTWLYALVWLQLSFAESFPGHLCLVIQSLPRQQLHWRICTASNRLTWSRREGKSPSQRTSWGYWSWATGGLNVSLTTEDWWYTTSVYHLIPLPAVAQECGSQAPLVSCRHWNKCCVSAIYSWQEAPT